MTLKRSDNPNEQTSDSSASTFEQLGEQSVKQMPLKKQQVFDPQVAESTSSKEQLKGTKAFDPHTPVQQVNVDVETLIDEVLLVHPTLIDVKSVSPQRVKSPPRSWLARLAALSLLLLIIVETGLGLRDAWLESPWLFSFYGVVLGVVSAWALAGAVSEYRKLKRLKQVAETQETGARLAQSMQMGEADSFIDNIVCHYDASQGLQQLRRSLKDEHNDAEKVLLFESLVLTERDELAKKVVRRYAAESAVLLAASPLAVLDMVIILWRNQRLLHDVAGCYGIELGYWSRIKLIRSIIINIIYAGTSELITDLGTQLLSVEMTGKLSVRLAQGLGGGMLTARLGYQAMALCRPIMFREEQRPKLSKVHQELLIELKQFSSKLYTKEGREALKDQLVDIDNKVSRTVKNKSRE